MYYGPATTNQENPYDKLYRQIAEKEVVKNAEAMAELEQEFAHLIQEAEMVYLNADVIAPL